MASGADDELADALWAGHRRQHASEKELADLRWQAHREQHESIAHNLGEYKAQSNEHRGTLADLRATFAPLSRVDAVEKAADKHFEELRDMIHTEREERREQHNLRVGQERGMSQTTAIIVGAVGLIATIVSVVVVVATFVLGAGVQQPVMP